MVIGMMPQRLMRPIVGLMTASMLRLEGPMIEPPVSVPTFAAQKLDVVPVPEEEPHGVEHTAAVVLARTRIAPRVIRIERKTRDGAVSPRRTLAEVAGVFTQCSFGEDDSAVVFQILGERRIPVRHKTGETDVPATWSASR